MKKNLHHHDEDEVDEVEDEVEDEVQVIHVKTYQLMQPRIINQHQNLIQTIITVQILLKYVHSNVISDTFGTKRIINVKKQKLIHEM
jgi:hypothetical protein